ncbi:MAG: hypothetical protein JW909_13970 [Planctomycetes bacterium]|nr:hypothetical protein [Planctomycetota bacterium]
MAGTAAFLLLSRRSADMRLFRACIGVAGICSVMAALAPRPAYLMAAVAGLCGGFVVADIATSVLLPSLIQGSPRRILAAKYAFISLIGVVTPFAGGLLMSWSVRQDGPGAMSILRSAYLIAGLAMLAGCFLLGRRHVPAADPAPAPLKQRWTVYLVPAVLTALHGGTDSAMARWAPTFYGESFARVLFPPAWVLSGCALAYFLGRTVLSIIPEGRAERFLLVGPGVVGGCLLMAALVYRSFGASVGLYVGASLVYGLEFPVLMGLIARRMPAQMGRAIALGGLATYGLYGGLSVLIGTVAQVTGDLRTALLVCPLGFVSFSVLAAVWTRSRPRVPSSAEQTMDSL